MGIASSYIIINSSKPFDEKELAEKLGYEIIEEVEAIDFDFEYPPEGIAFIGSCNGNWVISDEGLPFTMLGDSIGGLDKDALALGEMFPDTEIFISALEDTSMTCGFLIWKNNQIIRHYFSVNDEEVLADQGDSLPEETIYENVADELSTEEKALAVTKRYFKDAIDEIDAEGCKMRGFSYGGRGAMKVEQREAKPNKSARDEHATKKPKKWWQRLWG